MIFRWKPDAPVATIEEWVEQIHLKTGYDKGFLAEALTIYKEMGSRFD